jgi:hypothetical protein
MVTDLALATSTVNPYTLSNPETRYEEFLTTYDYYNAVVCKST